MPRFGSHWLQLARLASLLAIALPYARADRPVWAGSGNGGTGNANNGNNWLGSNGNTTITPPGQTDVAVVDHGKATFLVDTSLGGLVLTGNSTTNTTGSIDGNGTLTLLLSGATGSTWDAGSINFSSGGAAVVSNTASLTIQTSNSHLLTGGSIKNQGTTTWSGGTLNAGNGASIINDVGGTFDATADGTFAFDQGGAQPTFDNKGTFKKSDGSGGETNIAASFSNSGNVSVTSGRLTLHGGGSGNGSFNVSGTGSEIVIDNGYTLSDGASVNGPVRLTSGTLNASGNIAANGLSLEGGVLRGTQTFRGGNITWSSGDWNSADTTTLSGSAVLTISGTANNDFSGRAIANNGTINWTGGRLRSGNGGTLTNNGTLNDSASAEVNNDYGGTTLVFSNGASGTYNKTAAGNTTFNVQFDNSGTVNVGHGTLELHGGGSLHSGASLNASAGADVVFSNDYTISDASSLAGAGNFTVTAGTFTATGNVNVSHFVVSGGHVAGNQTLKGTLRWAGGDFNNSDTTTIDAAGTLTLSDASEHNFNGHQFVNQGTTNWTTGTFRSGSGGTFTNQGTFNDSASSDVNNDYGGTALVFTNDSHGTYNKTAAGTTIYHVSFQNKGTVNIGNGTLELNGGGSVATGGSINAAAGTHVVFSNNYNLEDAAQLNGSGDYTVTAGTLTASGNISVSSLAITGGEIAGSHTFNGKVDWSGGDFNGSGTTTITGGSTLALSGTGNHDFNGRAMVNNGTTNWTGGRLRAGGAATFTNNGTFNDTASNDVNNDYGGTTLVFTNAAGASYNKSGAGQTTFYVPLENSGTVAVGNGTLDLRGGGTLHSGGTLHADNGASVVFSNSYTLADASSLTGAGNFSVTAGTFTATGNVNVSNFSFAGGQLAGNQTFKGTLGWAGGDMNNGDQTTVDGSASLTISGTVEHDFNTHRIVNNGTTTWTAGRLRSGNGGTVTNNGTFVDSASSEINSDYGGTSLVFTNASGGTYRKTAAGNTTMNARFVNSGALDIQAGTLVLNTDSTFNNGSSMVGNGTLRQSGGVLTANGLVTLSNLQITGGSVDGTHTLAGSIEWSDGNFNNAGNTTVNGTFTIDTGVDHDFSAHAFNNSGTVNWVSGAGRLRSGSGGKFQNDGTFNDDASSTWNNDYLNAAAQFFNGTNGFYNKRSTGTTTFDGVTFVNAGTVNVTAGSLDLQGGGSSPVGAHFNASAGASLRFTGGNFAVADGSGFAGAGKFVIAGGKTTLGATVAAPNFELIGGTLGGTQTFTGGLSWTGGDMNDSGTTTTIGSSGKLTIDGTDDHDFSAHGIVNNGTVDWKGGRLRSGNGGSITNNGVFNDTSGSVLNNDYLNATVTFTNAAGGTYNKGGNNTTTYVVPFNNDGTIDVSSGILSLTAGGAIGNGAAFHGNGQVSLSSGVFTTTGTVDSTSLVIDGAQIAGSHHFTGSVKWNTGNFNTSGNTTIDAGATLNITSSADHDFSSHGIFNNGTIEWTTGAGRLRAGNGATFVNNGTFNDRASSAVNNDYLNATLVFTNAAGANYNKLATGNTDFAVPFDNNGAVNVSAGALVLHNGGTFGNGASFHGTGTTQLVGGTFTFGGAIQSDSLVLSGATLAGAAKLHGVFTFENGFLGSGASTTIESDGVMEITTSADHDLPGHTLVNNGTINWRGGRLRGGNAGTITNNGVFNDYASSAVNNDYQNTLLTFTNASTGVYNKRGSGTTTFAVPFTNNGTLNVSAGAMVFSSTFTNNGTLTFTNGASAQFSNALTFYSTTLGGTGTLNAPSVTAGATVSPGNSPGTLAITGDFTMLTSAVLLIDLGGRTQGSDYDYLNVGGNVTLAGTLSLRFVNGFESSILSSDTFTILNGSGLTGAFGNVLSGQRLVTADGLGSFEVNYGAGLTGVTLSNFQAIPEPDTYVLFGLGIAAIAVIARRRRGA